MDDAELDVSGKRSMVLCGSSSSGPCPQPRTDLATQTVARFAFPAKILPNGNLVFSFEVVIPDAYVAVGQVEDGDYCDTESIDSCDEALYEKLNTRRSTSPGNLPAPSSPEGARIVRRTLRVPTDPLPAEPPGYTRPPDFLTP